MTFTKIFCPIDFSAGSQHAARVAIRIAKESGAELVLAHAWYIPATAYSLEAPLPGDFIQGIVDDSQHRLDAAVKEAIDAGARHTTGVLLTGLPWTQLVAQLEKHAYDLCVIGTHGRTGLARVLLGSVAEKVVRHAPCPVLAIRPDGEPSPFRHALVPTDFSESAAHALDLAATLVEPGGSITLLHVIEAPVAWTGEVPLGEPPASDLLGAIDYQARRIFDNEVARFRRMSTLPITARSRVGYAGAQTLSVIDADPTIDLVVMGSHGRTGIKRVLLGSVAEKVVRHARCPVLVARKRA